MRRMTSFKSPTVASISNFTIFYSQKRASYLRLRSGSLSLASQKERTRALPPRPHRSSRFRRPLRAPSGSALRSPGSLVPPSPHSSRSRRA